MQAPQIKDEALKQERAAFQAWMQERAAFQAWMQERAAFQAWMQERAVFQAWMQEVDPDRVVVVDETGFVRGTRLAYGYSQRGERVYDTAPVSKGKRLNVVGWMRLDGSGGIATHVGTVNGPIFRGFVVHELVEHLRAGDIVVWDNARIHEVEGLREAIQRRGAEVKPLPAYSPDFNPIETGYLMRYSMWSKLKQWVRRARADTLEALEEAVEQAVSCVRASDMWGWYRHCGFCPQSN